jgi:hypothetical protein
MSLKRVGFSSVAALCHTFAALKLQTMMITTTTIIHANQNRDDIDAS